jgi:hypothetical protein
LHVGYCVFGWFAKVYPILPVEDLPEFGGPEIPYTCGGATALWDGVGSLIDGARQRIATLPPHQRPGRVIVVCQTDGEENQSKNWKARDVAKLVGCCANEGWELLFVGEGSTAASQGRSLGFARSLNYGRHQTEQMVGMVSLASVALRTGVDLPLKAMTMADLKHILANHHVGGLT